METKLGQELLGHGAGAGDDRKKVRSWGAQATPRKVGGEPEVSEWAEAGTFSPCTSWGSPRTVREGKQLFAGEEAQEPRIDGAAPRQSRRGTSSGAPGRDRPVASQGRGPPRRGQDGPASRVCLRAPAGTRDSMHCVTLTEANVRSTLTPSKQKADAAVQVQASKGSRSKDQPDLGSSS